MGADNVPVGVTAFDARQEPVATRKPQVCVRLNHQPVASLIGARAGAGGSRIPPWEHGEPQPIGPFIAKRIDKANKKVLRDGRSITSDSAPERLHDLRKDAKRLRYLLECFGQLSDGKALRRS